MTKTKYILLEFDDPGLANQFAADVLSNELGMDIALRGTSATAKALARVINELVDEEEAARLYQALKGES